MVEVAIYAICDPRTGEARYVGKARDPEKRFKAHLREARRRSPLYDWIGALRSKGLTPTLKVLLTCAEADWPDQERRHIAWGRAFGLPLLNLAHGGDEPLCSTATRASNGRKAAAARPKYLMRTYRALESNIRESRRHYPHLTAKLEAGLAEFKALTDLNRRLGHMDLLDANLATLFTD